MFDGDDVRGGTRWKRTAKRYRYVLAMPGVSPVVRFPLFFFAARLGCRFPRLLWRSVFFFFYILGDALGLKLPLSTRSSRALWYEEIQLNKCC